MLLMFLESVWTYNKCMVFVFDLHWLDRALLTSVFLLLEDCTGLSHVTRRDLAWVIQLWNRVVWQKPLWEFNLGTPLCCRSTPEGFHLNFGLAGLRQVSIPTTEVSFAKEVLHMFLGVDWIWFGGSPLDFCWCMFSKFDWLCVQCLVCCIWLGYLGWGYFDDEDEDEDDDDGTGWIHQRFWHLKELRMNVITYCMDLVHPFASGFPCPKSVRVAACGCEQSHTHICMFF